MRLIDKDRLHTDIKASIATMNARGGGYYRQTDEFIDGAIHGATCILGMVSLLTEVIMPVEPTPKPPPLVRLGQGDFTKDIDYD